jgi:hypothetical protein
LHVSEVSTNHHFKYSEKLTVGDEAVVVHIVDLESETELLFAGGSSGKGVEAMNEFKERDAAIFVLI